MQFAPLHSFIYIARIIIQKSAASHCHCKRLTTIVCDPMNVAASITRQYLGNRCFPRSAFSLHNLGPSSTTKACCLRQKRTFAKVSAISLTSKRRHGHKISMVTAYDYPSAIHVARAGIDVILVGDSVAMVELGHPTTQPVTMDAMVSVNIASVNFSVSSHLIEISC